MIFDPQKNEMFGAKTVSIFIVVMLGLYYVVWRFFLQEGHPSVQQEISSSKEVQHVHTLKGK